MKRNYWGLFLSVTLILVTACTASAVEIIVNTDTANVNRSVGDSIWFDSNNNVLGTIGLDTINGSQPSNGFMNGVSHTQWSFLKYDNVANTVAEITGAEKVTDITLAGLGDVYYDGGVVATITADQAIGLAETTRDLVIDGGSTLDLALGGMMFHGPSHWIKSNSGGGFLTSSSGELALVTNGGSPDYSLNNVAIKDFDGATPLALIKAGPDALNLRGGVNTHTGGTFINNGRLQTGNVANLSTGDVTVTGNGQAYLAAGGTYNNNFIISGDGWTEGAGQLGAIRLNGNEIAGTVTLAGDARIGADGTAKITGLIVGGTNTFTKAWGGTLVLENTGNTMGKTKVTGGYLRIVDQDALGATPASPLADSITLSGNGKIMGGSSTGGNSITLDANRGITLAGNGGFHAWTGHKITVDGDITGTGQLQKSDGGDLELNGNVDIDGKFTSNHGTVTVNGDLNLTGALETGNNMTLNLNSNTVAAGGGLHMWNTTMMNIDVGSAAFADIQMGDGGNQAAHVTQTAGDVTCAADMRIGHWGSATSSWTMQGGSLTLTGTVTNPDDEGQSMLFLGIDGTGVFNLEAGTVTVPGINADGRWATPGGIDTLAVTGGVLNVGEWGIRNGRNNGSTGYLIQLGGGTVGATADWSSGLNMELTGTNGEITIDTASQTVTLGGVLSGIGGLVKAGAGTLVVNGVNTYTGSTQVNAGTLGGTGTLVSAVTVAADGAIAPGDASAAGVLTVETLNLLDGSESSFRADAGDQLVVAGLDGLTVGAGTHSVNIVGAPSIGTYALIDYDGTINGSGAFQLGAINSRVVATLDVNAVDTTIDLNVTAIDSAVWVGNVNGTWDVDTTQNWKLLSNSSTTTFLPYDKVIFNDSATTGDINVAEPVTVASMDFDNSSVDYTLTGNGIAGSTAALTKDGSGSLTVLNKNTYGGTTTINAGTLILGDGTSGMVAGDIVIGASASMELNLASGAVLSGAVDNAATVTISGSNDSTLAGQFTGGGDIVMNGTGTVTMSAGNNLITNIEINSGAISVTGGNWGRSFFADQAGRSITINDGGKLVTTTHSLAGLGTAFFRPLITINEGGTWQLDREQYFSGNELKMTGGLVHVVASDLRLQGGTLEVFASEISSQITGAAITLHGSPTFQVEDGGAEEDFIVTAPISGGHSISKTGPGLMVTSGGNTYSGTTTVSEGILLVEGTHTGGGTYTVGMDATLGGNGSLDASVVALDGGIIAPGTSAGTLAVGGIQFDTGSIYMFDGGDLIDVAGNLSIPTSGANLELALGGLKKGSSIPIINYGSFSDLIDNFIIDATALVDAGILTQVEADALTLSIVGNSVMLNGLELRPPFSPDIDGDGYVGGTDMNLLLSDYIPSGGSYYTEGELGILLDNYGSTISNGAADATVPEPSTMVLMLLGAMGLLAFRRRK